MSSTLPRSPGVAAVLSFFVPGLGQLYNGQLLKWFLFFAPSAVCFLIAFAASPVYALPCYAALWLLSIWDADSTTERMCEAKKSPSARRAKGVNEPSRESRDVEIPWQENYTITAATGATSTKPLRPKKSGSRSK